jgi:U3 small nucleolar ribonucleoprotein protein IMP4
MLRRNARLRREFLYRKSLEGKEQELYEKKRKIRQALEGEFGRLYRLSSLQTALR